MTSLSPNGRALLDEARRALQPSAADCDRVANQLRAQLGPQVFAPELAQKPPSSLAAWRLVPAATAVCLVGGALLVPIVQHLSKQAPTGQERHPSAEAATPPSGTPSETAQEGSPNVTSRQANAKGRHGMELHRRDRLGQEVSLLERATSAVRARQLTDALRALEAHERRFPHGLLSEERHAAKAQALCLLRRVAEGRAEIAQLAVDSLAARRAREVCDEAASQIDTHSPTPRGER